MLRPFLIIYERYNMEDDRVRQGDNPLYEAYKDIDDTTSFADLASPTLAPEQTKTGEFIDRESFFKLVETITQHPAFSFEASGLAKEYDEAKMEELYEAIHTLKERVDSEHLELEMPDRLEAILAEDEESYPFNHDYRDVSARTAYGLLCGKGGNCISFSEVCCIMLNLYGYKPTPVLSRLNKRGAACHYVTCFENKDGEVEILDPERRRSCSEPEKQYSLTAYQGSLRYAVPTMDFSRVKIGGAGGIGPAFDDYFSDKPEQVVKPITLMMQRLEREADDIGMYEAQTEATRINLKANSMNSRKSELLERVISDILRPIYERSSALMMEVA